MAVNTSDDHFFNAHTGKCVNSIGENFPEFLTVSHIIAWFSATVEDNPGSWYFLSQVFIRFDHKLRRISRKRAAGEKNGFRIDPLYSIRPFT